MSDSDCHSRSVKKYVWSTSLTNGDVLGNKPTVPDVERPSTRFSRAPELDFRFSPIIHSISDLHIVSDKNLTNDLCNIITTRSKQYFTDLLVLETVAKK